MDVMRKLCGVELEENIASRTMDYFVDDFVLFAVIRNICGISTPCGGTGNKGAGIGVAGALRMSEAEARTLAEPLGRSRHTDSERPTELREQSAIGFRLRAFLLPPQIRCTSFSSSPSPAPDRW